MNFKAITQTVIQRIRRRPAVSGAIGVAAVILLILLFSRPGSTSQELSYYEVKRGDFLISIVEGGTIEAVNEVSIRNEVEGTARIIFIVPEGATVKKGDLLVELDSSQSQDAVNQQQINVEKSQFGVIQADQQLEIQKSIADSEIQLASNRVEFARTDLGKFQKGEAMQSERNAQIEITNVLENLQINRERLAWTEELYKQGYESKANLDKDRLSVSQTSLRLEQAMTNLWMLKAFDEPKRRRQLEAAMEEAQENLARAILQADRRLAQAEADLTTQKRTLELSQTKLDRDKKQLEATKIYAPQDGLVVYGSPGGGGGRGGGGGGGFSSESMIEEGAVVRNRQEIIKLPDVSAMKLTVRIHESHINNVRRGQPAFVVLDSMPDQRFQGVVNKVAPLPDSSTRFGNPNLKVYVTEIVVTDKLDVKPGVSARAEVIVTNLENVLTVPIQAVTTRKGRQVVFLANAPQQPVPVTVGRYNTRFIEVALGLKAGDRVLLAPPFDSQEKDLGGAVLAQGEELPATDTNQAARALAQIRNGNGSDPLSPDAPAGERQRGGGGRGNREEMLKQFDKNNDGQLDDEERAAMQEQFGGRGGGRGGGGRGNREEMLKQFDKNNDGQLDDEERAAMQKMFGGRGGGRRSGGTNAPPEPVPR